MNVAIGVGMDKLTAKQWREQTDRLTGHELETKKPEWFLVNIVGINLIPGTEAPSTTTVLATVVVPNEYGEMRKANSIDSDHWLEMADAEEPVCSVYDRVMVAAVFNSDGKRVYTPIEEI